MRLLLLLNSYVFLCVFVFMNSCLFSVPYFFHSVRVSPQHFARLISSYVLFMSSCVRIILCCHIFLIHKIKKINSLTYHEEQQEHR